MINNKKKIEFHHENEEVLKLLQDFCRYGIRKVVHDIYNSVQHLFLALEFPGDDNLFLKKAKEELVTNQYVFSNLFSKTMILYSDFVEKIKLENFQNKNYNIELPTEVLCTLSTIAKFYNTNITVENTIVISNIHDIYSFFLQLQDPNFNLFLLIKNDSQQHWCLVLLILHCCKYKYSMEIIEKKVHINYN